MSTTPEELDEEFLEHGPDKGVPDKQDPEGDDD